MARGEWGQIGRCSYKRTTLVVCSANIVVALYVLRSLYISLYTYPFGEYQTISRNAAIQIRKMQDSNQIRKASEPTELIRLLQEKYRSEEKVAKLPRLLKEKLTHEILDRLKSLTAPANTTEQRESIDVWRKEKLAEAQKLISGETLDSTILPEEAGTVNRVLSSGWDVLLEEIGLWIPVEIVNKAQDDKPEGEEDDDIEILPGQKLPPECHAELHTDYDGAAVRWGLTHHKESAYDCCMACINQAKYARPGQKRCNIWVYCPSESGCHSPDRYEHKNQECWLKYSERPKLNFKDMYPQEYRYSHPNAPVVVPWVSGVVSM